MKSKTNKVTTVAQVQKIALAQFLAVVHSAGTVHPQFWTATKVNIDGHAGTPDSAFRFVVEVNVDGSVKLLLVIGSTHPSHEDGSFIAVLNPDAELLTDVMIRGCCLFGSPSVVLGKCDVMIHAWVDAYKNNRVVIIKKYVARKPSPAKFALDRLALVLLPEVDVNVVKFGRLNGARQRIQQSMTGYGA